MQRISYDARYFNPRATLECGQIFRFTPFKKGYKVFSAGEACYVFNEGSSVIIESENVGYFHNFFDLDREYAAINAHVAAFNVPVLTRAAQSCKGLRLLKQNEEETFFSFIISQNNNIPRIKGIIEKICLNLGDKRSFMGEDYHTFPSAQKIAQKDAAFFKELGAGYRDKFLTGSAQRIAAEGLSGLHSLTTKELKTALLTYPGVGPKVADCISLFGFSRGDSFPVDTWIEKLYREDFNGTLKDRNKINAYFTSLFGEYSGLVQQYLFYYKRTLQ